MKKGPLKPLFLSVVIVVCLWGSKAVTAEAPPPVKAGPELSSQSPSAPAGDAIALHLWPDRIILGLDARGRVLAYDNTRRVFETHNLEATPSVFRQWNVPPVEGRIFNASVSQDRQTLATLCEVGANQSLIRLWNPETGEPRGPEFDPSDVAHVAFSPDGTLLAGVVARDGTIRVWDAVTGAPRWSKPLPRPMQTTWLGLRFSPGGSHIAARNSYGFVLWDMVTGNALGNDGRIFLSEVNFDCKLALGGVRAPGAQELPRSGLLNIADPGKPVPAAATVPRDLIDSMEWVAFSPDGRYIAVALRDRTVQIWDLAVGKAVHRTPATEGRIYRMLLSADNQRLATYESDPLRPRAMKQGKIRLWDLSDGRSLGPPALHAGSFRDWRFDDHSRHLLITFSHGRNSVGAQVWRLGLGEPSGASTATSAVPVSTTSSTEPGTASQPAKSQAHPSDN